ncbi:MAG TPA: inosine/xanthosine triphosphatase [Candidatus Saccharimonadales bacterium]|jgi:inosine/xanthosine triphosphatase
MKKILVASQNPIKIKATLEAFTRMFPDERFDVEGISVASGVSEQPSSDSETYQGALNRATNASTAAPDADFWVGLEGGIEVKNSDMESFAWMIVRGPDGLVGKGRTATFFLPPKVAELIHEGKELGEADDIVFGKTNSKQANGAVGLLTHDVIVRSGYYTEAIIFALIPFKNKSLYT